MITEEKIYWLFKDGSIAHITGKPFMTIPVAWKLNQEKESFDLKKL